MKHCTARGPIVIWSHSKCTIEDAHVQSCIIIPIRKCSSLSWHHLCHQLNANAFDSLTRLSRSCPLGSLWFVLYRFISNSVWFHQDTTRLGSHFVYWIVCILYSSIDVKHFIILLVFVIRQLSYVSSISSNPIDADY